MAYRRKAKRATTRKTTAYSRTKSRARTSRARSSRSGNREQVLRIVVEQPSAPVNPVDALIAPTSAKRNRF